MARRKKYEKTKTQVNVDTRIQSATLDYSGLMKASQIQSEGVQKLTQFGAEIAYDKLKTDAAKKAQRRAVDNDPYAEYYNTKDSQGLEDRLTNELVLTEIGNDYIEDVSVLSKELELDSLGKLIPGNQFDALLDRKVLDLYQQFRVDRLDSPLLELEARKTLDPYIKRMKIGYREKLLSQLKTKNGTASKTRGMNLAKYWGLNVFTEDGPAAKQNYDDWVAANPLAAQQHSIDLGNAFKSARFDALVTVSKADDTTHNTITDLQMKLNIINTYKVDVDDANDELYLHKEKIKNGILTQAGVTTEATTEDAKKRLEVSHKVWVEENRETRTPELAAMYMLIDANISNLNKNNYKEFIAMHNKTLYPLEITVREPDGSLNTGPVELNEEDTLFWRAASQSSLEAYTEKRMEQYETSPTKFVEALLNLEGNILDANGDRVNEIADRRNTLGVPIIDITEIGGFLNKVNSLQSREEAKLYVTNFFDQFTLPELSSLAYPMLTKLGDNKTQFITYLNAAIQDKINNKKDRVLDKVFLGNEQINNAAARPKAKEEKTNDDTLQDNIREYTRTHLTEEMIKSGIKADITATIENDMRAYIYGNQEIAYGSEAAAEDGEIIENAFRAVTGYQEENNQQVNGYGAIGDNDSVVHLRGAYREKEFSDVTVGYDTLNDTIDTMDTSFLNAYMYIKDPETGEMVKWEEGYKTFIHPFTGRVTLDAYNTQTEPEKDRIDFTAKLMRNLSFKNSKANPDFYTIKDEDNVTIVMYKGRPVELMIDLKKAAYDFQKYVQPNLQYVGGETIDDDVLIDQGWVNMGPGDIGSATYTRRFLLRSPREGDILVSPTGLRLKYSKLHQTTGMVKNMVEIRDRAITLETKAGTSFGAMEYGAEFQDFFGENE